jgi:hypothetical protein
MQPRHDVQHPQRPPTARCWGNGLLHSGAAGGAGACGRVRRPSSGARVCLVPAAANTSAPCALGDRSGAGPARLPRIAIEAPSARVSRNQVAAIRRIRGRRHDEAMAGSAVNEPRPKVGPVSMPSVCGTPLGSAPDRWIAVRGTFSPCPLSSPGRTISAPGLHVPGSTNWHTRREAGPQSHGALRS